ncbi:winged helix-turn-helix transcriptional regulator [Pedobacter polaris]|uniref:Winged helix-turn-helix transcriptional regulator n=1 Tax=Pedobacter polaris TaxID=2571273 RepID=A0A4U1CSS5_9SPHI|nr:MarR family winged helix-turn-helix transcriptional regulator [Pedobacter polaris]TKC10813.1 winged helix-turn-helix transcriptional regulator [Pedobacter polaris]
MVQLQKEVKVSKFENVYQQTLINVMFTYHWSNQKVKELIEPFAITPQQYNVLRILRGQYPSPATVNLIKNRILDKMSDTSRIVDRLIQKEYVEKTINSYDKRAVDVIISEKGLALLKKMDKQIDFSTFIAPNLTDEEAKQLNSLLDKMRG